MRVLLKFFLPFILFFSAFASALDIEGPSHSSDGSFSISWQPLDNSLRCHDLKISVKSNLGFDEYFDVSSEQVTYDFHKLPPGVYTLVFSGVCDGRDSTGDWKEVAFGALALTVEHEAQKISGIQSGTADLNAKSVVPEAQATSVSASAADLGWRCGTVCPAGTSSEFRVCDLTVDLSSGVTVSCPMHLNEPFCGESSPANAVFCVVNTDDFRTCDWCPSGYDTVGGHSVLKAECISGWKNRCVLNTAPPAAVTLSGTTARQDATIELSWRPVSLADYYEWKLTTQSSWKRIAATSVTQMVELTISNLSSGQRVVQVRACNEFGCGPLSSRTITLSAPDAPTITSNSTAPAGNFSLTWTSSNSATRYMWKRDNGNWQNITGQEFFMNLVSGTYTFYVRACNTVDCGAITSKTITLTPPASPFITSPGTSLLETYPMTWTTVVNANHYEWRINSGSWVQANTTSAAVSNLPFGSSTLYVRACTSLECGQPRSLSMNSTYDVNNPPSSVLIASYQYVIPSCRWNWVGGGGNTSVSVLLCGVEATTRSVAQRTTTSGQCTFIVTSSIYSLEYPNSCTGFRITGPIAW